MALTPVEKSKRYRARKRGEYVPPVPHPIIYNDKKHEYHRKKTAEYRKQMKAKADNNEKVFNEGITIRDILEVSNQCINGKHELNCPQLDCKCKCHADEYKG